MKYELLKKNLYNLKTDEDLNIGNSFLYKPCNNEGVLIDPPTDINLNMWISSLQKVIALEKISYIVIQNFNSDPSTTLKELKLKGVDATIICTPKGALYHLFPWKIETSWEFISKQPSTFYLDENKSFTVQINPLLNGQLDLVTIIPEEKILFSGSLFSSFNESREFDGSDKAWFSIIDFYRSFIPTFQGYKSSSDTTFLNSINIIAPGRGSIIELNYTEFIESLKKYESNRDNKFIDNQEVTKDDKLNLLSQPLNKNVFNIDYLSLGNNNDLDLSKLKHKLAESSIDQITNSTTELFNETYFKKFMNEELEERLKTRENGSCLYIQLNNKDYLTTAYNSETMNRISKNIAREFEMFIEETEDRFKHRLFHLNRDIFCYYIPEGKIEYFLFIAEKLQKMVKETTIFTELLSISIGIVTFDEIHEATYIEPFSFIHDRGLFRLKSALRNDTSHINFEVLQEDFIDRELNPPLVVIISSDEIIRGVIKFHLESNGFEVKDFSDSLLAYDYISNNKIKLIIADLYLEKLDGLSLKEKLNEKHILRKIPFILTTSMKVDNIVIRAHALDISYIFLKPVSLVEITGLSKKLVIADYEAKK